MNVDSIKEHLESRRLFLEKSDKELLMLLGIPEKGTTVGLSCDDSFVGSVFPTIGVVPDKGIYHMDAQAKFAMVEVVDIDLEKGDAILTCSTLQPSLLFRLPFLVFEVLFKKYQ